MNERLKRVNDVVGYLKREGIVDSQKDMAGKIGFSIGHVCCVLGGKYPLTVRFVNRVCRLDERLNAEWVFTGEGEMVKGEEPSPIAVQQVSTFARLAFEGGFRYAKEGLPLDYSMWINEMQGKNFGALEL